MLLQSFTFSWQNRYFDCLSSASIAWLICSSLTQSSGSNRQIFVFLTHHHRNFAFHKSTSPSSLDNAAAPSEMPKVHKHFQFSLPPETGIREIFIFRAELLFRQATQPITSLIHCQCPDIFAPTARERFLAGHYSSNKPSRFRVFLYRGSQTVPDCRKHGYRGIRECVCFPVI